MRKDFTVVVRTAEDTETSDITYAANIPQFPVPFLVIRSQYSELEEAVKENLHVFFNDNKLSVVSDIRNPRQEDLENEDNDLFATMKCTVSKDQGIELEFSAPKFWR